MKLYTKTFGCQMNFADSDEMTRHLKQRGFSSTEDEGSADAFLINTCTVRDLAEHKAMSYIGKLKEWKGKHPDGLIIVTGCAAERTKDTILKKFRHIDLVVGAKDIETFPAEIDKRLGTATSEINVTAKSAVQAEVHRLPESAPPSLSAFPTLRTDERSLIETSAYPVIQYVTVMRGCNYNCTYCIVPSVRGREIYIPLEKILKDTADRVAEGAKEIWLLGQTVNSYKATVEGFDFSDLLRAVGRVPGVERIRFMSPHPYYLNEKLARAMAETPQVCEFMHLPAQSGSNAVLRRMKRNYTRESYLAGVQLLRRHIPDISITTDLIVGFPGETKEDFEATKTLVEEAGFDAAYCFKYSVRPGTEAAKMEDDIPESLKEGRVNELLELTEKQGRAKAAALIGTKQEVLIEDDKGGGLVRGRNRGAWRVRIKDSQLKVGEKVSVEITGTHSRELHGVEISRRDIVVSRP